MNTISNVTLMRISACALRVNKYCPFGDCSSCINEKAFIGDELPIGSVSDSVEEEKEADCHYQHPSHQASRDQLPLCPVKLVGSGEQLLQRDVHHHS